MTGVRHEIVLQSSAGILNSDGHLIVVLPGHAQLAVDIRSPELKDMIDQKTQEYGEAMSAAIHEFLEKRKAEVLS